MMNLFDGRAEAKKLDYEMSEYISNNTVDKTLLIIQIGDNAPSEKYANLKVKTCEKLGINASYKKIDESLNDIEILSQVEELFIDENIGGGIIQLPLPRNSIQDVLNKIPYSKDLDMLSSTSINQFYSNNTSKLPPVVCALKHFMVVNTINTQGLRVGVVGGGTLVGLPITYFLLSRGAKVTILDDSTKSQSIFSQNPELTFKNSYKKGQALNFDMLVLSAGIPKLVLGEDITDECHVVDFGSTILEGKTVGDLDLSSSIEHLGYVSPSPGGMGPLVVRYLIMNFLGI